MADFKTLEPEMRLNDNTYYMMMIENRAKLRLVNSKKILCLNTIFWLSYEKGYSNVRKWTSKKHIDIFSYDFILGECTFFVPYLILRLINVNVLFSNPLK